MRIPSYPLQALHPLHDSIPRLNAISPHGKSFYFFYVGGGEEEKESIGGRCWDEQDRA